MISDEPTLVAIDLGTKTGVAWQHKGEIATKALNFTKIKQMGAGMRPLMLRQDLLQIFTGLQPVEQLVFENVQKHSATYAAQIYGELRGCLMMVCEELAIPYRGLGVTTIKKHVTGKGLCKKSVTRRYMKNLWPDIVHDQLSDDEVDALSILKCAIDKVY